MPKMELKEAIEIIKKAGITYISTELGNKYQEAMELAISKLSLLEQVEKGGVITILPKWQDRVCSYCGGKLEEKDITDTFGSKEVIQKQIVCMPCSRIESGVSQEIFDLASDMVRIKGFTHYRWDIVPDEENRIKADISHYAKVIVYIFNSAIDLCNAHLVKKMEGIANIIRNFKIGLNGKRYEDDFPDKLSQAIITHLMGGKE